ncbi:hypothetical protein SARC_02042 [Sphaeroforma arctica JP610]|uniref:Uncharacterized protein n=1 Tax=Sphaeroforma arctica JP610 TaxID=667725 RepID=A0A0L0GA41_9EUKA|nr:hypothetical protein SARC_02042 [Sphaeroforma arctica JP610]KNC85779.1 hypothetical protein SARC_02042 [Sphaeroforma arctica JP610]|eukprot:XP_014159681.1 hypothetical protein SARC_02042 [Sphaeroforma arctica JP610]
MSTPLLGVAQESIKKSEIEAVISPDYGKVHIIKKGFGGTISTAVKLNTDLKVIVKSVDKDAAPDWVFVRSQQRN